MLIETRSSRHPQDRARGRFERQRRPPYPDHRATIAMANVKRTVWSPKWLRTRQHGHGLNGTRQQVALCMRTRRVTSCLLMGR